MSKHSKIFHPTLRVFQIWGTHSGVGKTRFAEIMCWAAARIRRANRARERVVFMTPLMQGSRLEAEHVRVKRTIASLLGNHTPKWFKSTALSHRRVQDGDEGVAEQMRENNNRGIPLKPVGNVEDGTNIKDDALLYAIRKHISSESEGLEPPGGWFFLETPGAVDAPLPSGNSQADVYRSLGLPAILVGDAKEPKDKVIAAFDSLHSRGYDVQAVAVYKGIPEVLQGLEAHFGELGIPCVALREIPPRRPLDPRKERKEGLIYCRMHASMNRIKDLIRTLHETHNARVKAGRASEKALP